MARWRQYAIVAATLLAWPGVARADLRAEYEDAAVVERSELIVVGHLDKDSIKYVPHEKTGDHVTSWEHHATLVVTEILKGALKETRIPIVINYGLDPLVGGRTLSSDKNTEIGSPDSAYPKDRIDIVDTASRAGTVLEDAQKDNLWFLRRLGGNLGREAGQGRLGIRDPEDVAALKFKSYFATLLSKDADHQIDRLLADADEAVVARSLRHLSAQRRPSDASRIVKLLSSPSEKVRALAAQALAEVADLSDVPTFREALGPGNPDVRATACIFLCRFRDTESIPAMAKALRDLDTGRRMNVIAHLPRMESRAVVDLLLDQLDERLDATAPFPMQAYEASAAAAKALKTLTGVDFPLDSAQARRLWDKLKEFPDEVLLRKSVLENIEALTTEGNYAARWDAYEALGRLANRHGGSYDAFHSRTDAAGRETSQGLWRSWAKGSITQTRTDWIYAGFAESGIALPRPMDAKGIDVLIAVLEFYGDRGDREGPASTPNWSVDGGWVKGKFHRYNANRLLEQLTGYKVGFSPYHNDLLVNWRQNVSAERWAAWWKENRDQVRIFLLPEEKPVTAEVLASVPSLRQPSPPLSLTIRPKSAVHVFKGTEPLTILVEIKNTSAHDVLVAQRPSNLHYTWTGDGTCSVGGRGGMEKEDYVTLAPGQTITWEQTDAFSVDNSVTPPASIENLQYELTYCFAGTQFGLRAWRGKLLSNPVSCRIKVKE